MNELPTMKIAIIRSFQQWPKLAKLTIKICTVFWNCGLSKSERTAVLGKADAYYRMVGFKCLKGIFLSGQNNTKRKTRQENLTKMRFWLRPALHNHPHTSCAKFKCLSFHVEVKWEMTDIWQRQIGELELASCESTIPVSTLLASEWVRIWSGLNGVKIFNKFSLNANFLDLDSISAFSKISSTLAASNVWHEVSFS